MCTSGPRLSISHLILPPFRTKNLYAEDCCRNVGHWWRLPGEVSPPPPPPPTPFFIVPFHTLLIIVPPRLYLSISHLILPPFRTKNLHPEDCCRNVGHLWRLLGELSPPFFFVPPHTLLIIVPPRLYLSLSHILLPPFQE
jgi:hypothetical protein